MHRLTSCGRARPSGAAGRGHGAAGGGGRAHRSAAPAHRHHRGAAGTGLIKCCFSADSLSCMAQLCPVRERLPAPATHDAALLVTSWLLSCKRGAMMLAQPRRCWQRTAGCSHARCARPARRWSTPRCRCRARSVRACKQPARCPVTLLAATAFDADAYLARRLLSGVDDHCVTAHMHEECSLLAWCTPNRATLCCKRAASACHRLVTLFAAVAITVASSAGGALIVDPDAVEEKARAPTHSAYHAPQRPCTSSSDAYHRSAQGPVRWCDRAAVHESG